MAKSDSFFVRATVGWNGTTFEQTSVDLGAYVDALGKSVLRIHNIAVQWTQFSSTTNPNPGVTEKAAFQLTTQSQSAMIDASDKSIIATGMLAISSGTAGDTGAQVISESLDVAPQHWTNGYLVGVEQIYLGCDQSFNLLSTGDLCIVMECTVETLSQNAAMALALSQQ